MPQTTNRGARLFYEDTGSGPVMLLSHSWYCDGGQWPQAPALVDNGYRVLNLDNRGHGRYGPHQEPFTLWGMADDLVACTVVQGGAEYGARRKYLRLLENDWLVVDWEQRGAGRSYRGDEDASTLSLEMLVEDGVVLVGLLGAHFPGRPLVIVGHSFGTALGVLIVRRKPEAVAAYVGAAQVVGWARQEERSYDWALAEARRRGHAKAVSALDRIGPPVQGCYASGRAGTETQRRWLGTLGGVSADPKFLMHWAMSLLTARGYPLRAKIRYRDAMARSMDLVWPQLGREVDFLRDVTSFPVPVHIFAGRQDRITDLEQVEQWLAVLDAPRKRLEVVDDAGHLSLYEAPQQFVAFVSGVLAGL